MTYQKDNIGCSDEDSGPSYIRYCFEALKGEELLENQVYSLAISRDFIDGYANGSIYWFAVGTDGGFVNIYLGIRGRDNIFRYSPPKTIQPTLMQPIYHEIRSLAFSPTGRYLAIGTSGGELFVYDIFNNEFVPFEDGKINDQIVILPPEIHISWDPFEDVFVLAGGSTIKKYLVTSPNMSVKKLSTKTLDILEFIISLDFSPDGNFIAIGTLNGHFKIYAVMDSPDNFIQTMDYLLPEQLPINSISFEKNFKENRYNILVSQIHKLYILSTDSLSGTSFDLVYNIDSVSNIGLSAFSPDGLNIGFSNSPYDDGQSSGIFSLKSILPNTDGTYAYNLFVDSNCIFDGYDTYSIVFSPDKWYYFIGGGDGVYGKFGIFEYKY